MRFRVAATDYALHIASGTILNEGREVLSIAIEQGREIIISAKLPPEMRLTAITREISAAWMMHVGRPSTIAGWSDLMGTILAQLITDLSINGGVDAITRLRPGEGPQPGAAKIQLTRARQCGACGISVAGASVVCEETSTPGVLRMALYCDHCGHVQEWKEMAAPSGFPDGVVKGKPKFVKGAAVGDFLRKHPECGVGIVSI